MVASTAEKINLENPKKDILNKKWVKQGVKAVFALYENNPKGKKQIIDKDSVKIFLSVRLKVVPEYKKWKRIGVLLPNSLVTENTSVCVFVPNLSEGKERDDEKTLIYYKELLEQKGVTNISHMATVRQMKGEYLTFKAKRQLACSHDVFLVDSSISPLMPELVGKEFYRRKKIPQKVNLRASDLATEFKRSLATNYMHFPGISQVYTMEVGHIRQSHREVAGNIRAAAKRLGDKLPGGWLNVRTLGIFCPGTPTVPLYISGGSMHDVDMPAVQEKEEDPEAEELSTLPNHKVKVYSDGRVQVIREDSEDSGVDEDDPELLKEIEAAKNTVRGRGDYVLESSSDGEGSGGDSSSGDDGDEMSAVEQAFLKKRKLDNKQEADSDSSEHSEEEERYQIEESRFLKKKRLTETKNRGEGAKGNVGKDKGNNSTNRMKKNKNNMKRKSDHQSKISPMGKHNMKNQGNAQRSRKGKAMKTKV